MQQRKHLRTVRCCCCSAHCKINNFLFLPYINFAEDTLVSYVDIQFVLIFFSIQVVRVVRLLYFRSKSSQSSSFQLPQIFLVLLETEKQVQDSIPRVSIRITNILWSGLFRRDYGRATPPVQPILFPSKTESCAPPPCLWTYAPSCFFTIVSPCLALLSESWGK